MFANCLLDVCKQYKTIYDVPCFRPGGAVGGAGGGMSGGEGRGRGGGQDTDRATARAKSRSRGLADIDPKFISQVSSCLQSLKD